MKRNEKKQTIEDIAKNLLLLANDDEHITKQLLPELEQLLVEFSPQTQPFPNEEETTKEFMQFFKETSLFSELQANEIDSSNSDLQPLSKRIQKPSSNHSEKIVWEIQRRKAKPVTKVDLLNIAKYLSAKYQKPIPKRDKKAKGRILDWISDNWDIFQPCLEEAIDYALDNAKETPNKASTTEQDDTSTNENES